MELNTIFTIIIYFVIYSFFGWILESTYKTFMQKKIVNSGFLGGPFCPIYGCGALIMYYALDKYKDNFLLLFISGIIILSIWEYIVGIFLEKVFKTKYWDYSNYKFNFQGRICLRNSIFWGILGCIFILFVHPQIQNFVKLFDIKILIVISIIAMIYITSDAVFTIIRIIKLNKRLNILEEINNDIRLRLEKARKLHFVRKNIKLTRFKDNISGINYSLNNIISDLMKKKDMMLNKIEKQSKRLRKAFPTMQHSKLEKVLNGRKNVDIKRR